MNLRYIIPLLSVIIISFSISTTQSGCASIVPPTGGPRDSLPPFLLHSNPPDSTLNFKGKKITFNFDEYVQVDNVQQNLLISPVPKINPITDAKLKVITIQIKDTLEDNTTYVYDFGNAIRDINESNILKNFTYIFSTGSWLDSLKLGGKVIIAETGKTDSTLIVMLHRSLDDSAVVKERPRYIARVDKEGNFQFRNLAPGTFAIYALKDEGARRYLSKEQLFAFADSPVTSQSQRNDIVLYAFKAEDTTKRAVSTLSAPSKKAAPGADRILKIQTNVQNGELDLLSNLEIIFVSAPVKTFDSTKLVLTDTAFKPLSNYHFIRDTSNTKITLVYPWQEDTDYNLLIDTAFATDTSGRKLLKNDTLTFHTKKRSEYGTVKLRFLNLQLQKHPVLQIMQGDQEKYKHVFTNNQFNAELFPPGEYELRIFYDENGNGEWDTGQFFGKKRQPEKVLLIPRKINVKPNWESEVDIQL